jgi:hypothetical protein
LFGAATTPSGLAVARLAGFALLALGIGCWPGRASASRADRAVRGLLTYNALATIFLTYVVVRGSLHGVLLWPAIVLHAILSLLLLRMLL